MKERTAAVVGVGHSRIMRHADQPLGVLATAAALDAITDAGLTPAEIDGVSSIPEAPFDLTQPPRDGREVVSTSLLIRSLGLNPLWAENNHGGVGNSFIEAVNAVESGACDTALVVRALHSPHGSYGHLATSRAVGVNQFREPYGIFYPGIYAQMWQRYSDLYKTGTRDQMATVVLQSRANGLLNPNSYWSQHDPSPVTLNQYLGARMVSTPLSLLDCDLPIQAAGAFVITTAERAVHLPHPPAHVLSTSNVPPRGARNLGVFPLETEMAAGKRVGDNLWRKAGLQPKDVDVANLYDGFSFITMVWLEALGFCGTGEAFDFVQGGRTALDGELPLNTGGGNLGVGRMHGVAHLMDAILQTMGRAGARQVHDANISLAVMGPQSGGTSILLGRDLRQMS